MQKKNFYTVTINIIISIFLLIIINDIIIFVRYCFLFPI